MAWGEFLKGISGKINKTWVPICLPFGYPHIDIIWKSLISGNKIFWLKTKNIFSYNPNVWNTTSTIWDAWGLYSYLTSASLLAISSTNINDTANGTWARKIMICWLNANYEEIEEEIVMNGTTPVNTTKSFLRVCEMYVLTAWSQEKAIWIIKAQVWAVNYWQINDWTNKSLTSIYTIPKGKVWFLIKWKASSDAEKAVEVSFFAKPLWWVFILQHFFNLYWNNYEYKFEIPLMIDEKTDLEVRAVTIHSSAKVSASYDLILFDKKEFDF